MNDQAARPPEPELPAAEHTQTEIERALQESEQRYRLLLNSVTDYIYTVKVKDHQPIATYHGVGCATVTGYTSQDYEKDPYLWYRMIYPEDRAAVSAQVTQVLAGHTMPPLEHRILHKDGSVRWVKNTSVPRYDAQGQLYAYDGLVSDITERKRAEENLRATLHKTEALYHVARLLTTSESVTDLLQTVTDSVAEALPADRVILILVDQVQQQVTHHAIGGPGVASIVLAPYDELMEGLSGWVLRAQKPVLSPKQGPDLREGQRAQRRRAETRSGSIVVAPLHHRGKTMGTLTAINRFDQAEFTPQDVNLVMAMVNQVMVAIENTRLFEETSRLKTFNENIVQGVAEAILIEDAYGYYTFANPAAEELTGYTQAELVGRHWRTLTPENYIERIKAESARRASGYVSRYEAAILHKDKRESPVVVSARPLFDEGQFAGVLVALTDIGQNKQTEEALAHERDLLHALMDNVNDTIYFKDTAGHFTRINHAQARLLGVEGPEQAVSKTDFDFFTPEHAGEAYADEQAIIQTDKPLVGKLEHIRGADGQFRWVSCSKSPIKDQRGQVTGIVGISRDITDQIKAQEALSEFAAQLQARNEDLDAFAHTVAHDLKHALSVIIGLSEAFESPAERAAMPPEELNDYLARIARRARKMSIVIDELLFLASVRQAEDAPIERLDMAGSISEACERLSDMIKERQAQITLPERWPSAWGYAAWIEEVWVNYISNAIKYGGQPPRIELGFSLPDDSQTEAVSPDSDAGPGHPPNQIRFWVRDNGRGLTPEEQTRLFKPFTRLEQAHAHARGYGLGLSIVRRIVEKLGGQVGVESQVGQGSTFSFSLRAAKES